MIVLADSSPLIAFAKINCFPLFQKLFGNLIISSEVHAEVAIAGGGLAGAADVSASWVTVRQLLYPADLTAAQLKTGLGVGELSTILLAKEIQADLIILDDLGARKLAQKQGLKVQGSIGVLEASFRRGYLRDLRQAYSDLLREGIYLDRQLLNFSLKRLSLPEL